MIKDKVKCPKIKRYRVEIEFETEEEIGTTKEDLDGLLDGSWLYDNGFMGAVTKCKLKKRDKMKNKKSTKEENERVICECGNIVNIKDYDEKAGMCKECKRYKW